MGIRKKLRNVVVDVDRRWDKASLGLQRRLGRVGELSITTYRGLGNSRVLLLRGRVTTLRKAPDFSDDDDLWDNLVNMYRRLHTKEIPGARVRVSAAGVAAEVETDNDGFFEAELHAADTPFSHPRQSLELELIPRHRSDGNARASAEAVIRSPESRLLVISDIDDTVVHTKATDLLAMARATFLGNAATRTPFRGVAALYGALVGGASGAEGNPLVFISRSPWNLYDLFDQFCDLQALPAGRVFFLRDWGISREGLSRARERGHKFALIKRILELEKDLPVLLLGDSGQKDPEIYTAIVETFPGRVRGIVVRDINRSAARRDAVTKLAAEVMTRGTPLFLAEDSLSMARHAAMNGWIDPAAVEEVARVMLEDPDLPGLDVLLDETLADDSDGR